MLNLGQDEQCGKPISLPLRRGYTVDESHYSVPVVPHKAVAEVSKIGNL